MKILNSEIYLVQGIKLDRNYVNVLSYSENQMLELCKQNQVAHASNFSFIRPQNSIYVNFSYEDCLKANYIAFQNPDYSNKWFFAFIDEVIYKGERNTEITYKIDSWSTWFDYWEKQPCFISRQHVNDDTIGFDWTKYIDYESLIISSKDNKGCNLKTIADEREKSL